MVAPTGHSTTPPGSLSGRRSRFPIFTEDSRGAEPPGRDDHTYAAVLGEEFGEVCKAWLERDMEALRVELVQTAAVAVAWLEELDNGGSVPRA